MYLGLRIQENLENPKKIFNVKRSPCMWLLQKILVYWKRGVSVDMGQGNMVILMQKYQEGRSLSVAFPT